LRSDGEALIFAIDSLRWTLAPASGTIESLRNLHCGWSREADVCMPGLDAAWQIS
jgi:hypothetical protein